MAEPHGEVAIRGNYAQSRNRREKLYASLTMGYTTASRPHQSRLRLPRSDPAWPADGPASIMAARCAFRRNAMWRSSVATCVFMVAIAAAIAVWLGVGSASAQIVREPALEGVSYSEIAEWQGRYGGGPVPGCFPPGPPPQAYGCFPPPPCGWAPPACIQKKKVRRHKR
jgi:hypothetical protein